MAMKVWELLRLLRDNGWSIVRQKGSHRQLRHPANLNVITIAGKERADLRPGTLNDILKKAGLK
jgi:predicted RNA binding protein YcfA (HicA-like mRNA interferase family)